MSRLLFVVVATVAAVLQTSFIDFFVENSRRFTELCVKDANSKFLEKLLWCFYDSLESVSLLCLQ